MAVKGVDVSYANGNVDFGALKDAGIQFVIIRCGYGGDYRNQDDAQFENNVKNAESIGIPWGVYLYSYAKNSTMAQNEAQHVLRLLNGRKPAYGVWYDVEDPQIAGCDLVANCVTFCKAMEEAGLYCGIYSMLGWLKSKLDSPLLDKYDKWVAQWNATCDYKQPYGIWQYTDKLVICGKVFDGNYAYKDYPALTGGGDEEVRYNKISDIPKWAQATIKKLCDKKILVGNGGKKDENGYPADLDLSYDMIRMFDANDRAGLYD